MVSTETATSIVRMAVSAVTVLCWYTEPTPGCRPPRAPSRHLILVQGRGHQRRPRLVASPIAVTPLSVHTSRTANRRPVHPGSQGGDSGALTLGRQPLPDNTRRCHWSAIGVDVVPVAVPDIRAGANSTLR